MKLLTKRPEGLVLEEGATLDGYVVVDNSDDARAGAEIRYGVTAPGGERATLTMSRRPFADRQERARFRRLSELRIRLVHPGAIELRDFGEDADHPYVVTEPHGERTFADLLEEEGRLDPDRLITLLGPVAAALDTAHGMELVHPGLGTSTLFLGGDDVLVLDTSALLELDDDRAWSISERADPAYQPPELLRGTSLGPTGNVYSLAAVIVRALTGEPPYSGDRLAVRYARLVEPPPEPSTRVPELGSSIDVAIARGMSKDPLERPESASALLEEVAGALGIATAPVSPTVPRPVMPSRKHPSRARAAVAAATVAAALCGAVLGVGVDPLGEEARSARPEAEGIAAWKQLDSRRADLRARLAAAELPQEQGDLADQLAGAYDRAARALPIGTRAREARAARDAYAQLAAAAEAGDASEFAAASDAVTRAERQLQTRR